MPSNCYPLILIFSLVSCPIRNLLSVLNALYMFIIHTIFTKYNHLQSDKAVKQITVRVLAAEVGLM